ncbi:MAG: chromosome segregation protein SMC [Actinomycetota bacterium]|nr:chromosome segregation protein SMC [Actinomycetota bacterium]
MFLKSLTLKGFKSFAEATTLQLEPGVTVVVGPNGSGKSNVVDAIAWVLGAQAPSSVRSQKMDDVIFAGTASRAPLGRAEVSLTIDNSGGLLNIDFSEVTVRRTLFRTGDSEYAINGVPCRLLDVQELLSDAGVGRQQHVIVSQGQIDAVLNARPEDRRAIIEEAAGVLKYRKRKEKAERRLDATEANLLRVQDLLREVRRQLRPLERQAAAARRHGELIGELTTLRVFVAGREIAALRTKLTALAAAKLDAGGAETDLKSQLAQLDTEVLTVGAELTARGADDVTDRLRHVEALRERARGLAALIVERRRASERDRGQLLDAGVVASLEHDAARTREELDGVRADLSALQPDAERLELDEAAFAAERDGTLGELDLSPSTSASSAAAEVRGELRSVRAASERGGHELVQAGRRRDELAARIVELDARIETQRGECDAAELVEGPLTAQIEASSSRLADAAAAVESAQALRQEAVELAGGLAARVEALQLALDAAHARAGAARLANFDGVLGTLLDLVRIDAGWEPAAEAALGEALSAVVVADAKGAVRALHALRNSDTTGAVLALGLPMPPSRPAPPAGEAVRPHVTATDAQLDPLLDALLAAATRVDTLDEAVRIAQADADAVVVTAHGDRLDRTGWRLGVAAAGGITAAALDDAVTRAADAATLLDSRTSDMEAARARLPELRTAHGELSAQLEANDARFTAAVEELARTMAERGESRAEFEPLERRVTELSVHLDAQRMRLGELERLVPQLEAGEVAEADAARQRRDVRVQFDAQAAVLADRRRQLEVRAGGLGDRAEYLERRIEEIDRRLAADAQARIHAAQRRVAVERTLVALDRLGTFVDAHRHVLDAHHGELVERRRRQSEDVRALSTHLDGLRSARVAAERTLDETRERSRRAEIEEAEARLRLESAVELLRHDLDMEPEMAEAAAAPTLPEGVSAQARVRELDREVRLLGPINPLALEEFTELQQRHGFLEEQLEDVRTTRRELSRVIRAVDEEIQSVFAAAYVDVSTNFSTLFDGLFPGGSGRLVLTDPDDMLNTGIEVEAKPSGKNVKKLSLLSGGERSLTALAFLFAVFRSRPSPFYVMDEVEAALDDVNLHRFLGLLGEFRREAQLLIVSHQKRTMEAGDSLLGVTMQPGGSSRVIVERVAEPAGV